MKLGKTQDQIAENNQSMARLKAGRPKDLIKAGNWWSEYKAAHPWVEPTLDVAQPIVGGALTAGAILAKSKIAALAGGLSLVGGSTVGGLAGAGAAGLGMLAGGVTAAGAAGYGIGTAADKALGLSDKISEWIWNKMNPAEAAGRKGTVAPPPTAAPPAINLTVNNFVANNVPAAVTSTVVSSRDKARGTQR